MSLKKVLVIGASGAMGQYLVPELAGKGFQVDAVSFDDVSTELPNVTWINGNAKEPEFRKQLLSRHYDGIVDFLVYPTHELTSLLPQIVRAADHYIFLSSYRIYDGIEIPVRETSPRLLDSSKDIVLRNSDDYSIYKARGENVIRAMFPENNWTIIRPAITYSFLRNQLVTLEAPCTVGRALLGKSVILPETARNVQGTMTWAGDVAKMIAGLLFNEKARGEVFTVSTSEHHTWEEIAAYYKDICGLNAVWVDQEDFLQCLDFAMGGPGMDWRWQLIYDRLFDRVIDNSKILSVAGLKQENLMKLYDGLKLEVSRYPREYAEKAASVPLNVRMDQYLEEKGLC